MIAETCPTFILYLLLVEAALADTCNTNQSLGLFRVAESQGPVLCLDADFCTSVVARLASRESAAACRCHGMGKDVLLTRRAF